MKFLEKVKKPIKDCSSKIKPSISRECFVFHQKKNCLPSKNRAFYPFSAGSCPFATDCFATATYGIDVHNALMLINKIRLANSPPLNLLTFL